MRHLAYAVCAWGFACGGGGGNTIDAPGPDGPIPADCVEAESHSDLTWIQENIFAKQCTFSGCHDGEPSPQGMMNLTSIALAGSSTVDVLSVMCGSDPGGGSQYRVVPGHPEESWMMKMLGAIQDTTPSSCAIDPKVGIMPMDNNGELLCSQKLGAIQRWITAGAPAQ
jgi:hypothetical protein